MSFRIASLIVFAGVVVVACSSSDDDKPSSTGICEAGCLCFSVEACPAGCYVTTTASGTYCGQGIVTCGEGTATGTNRNNCGNGADAVDADGGFCCAASVDAGFDAADGASNP